MSGPTQVVLLDAVHKQAARLVHLVEQVPDDAFRLPTRTNGWDVATLVTHLTRVHSSVLDVLARPVTGAPSLTAVEYFTVAKTYSADVSALAVQQRAGRSVAELRDDLRAACTAGVTGLQETPAEQAVETRGGTMTLREFTWTRAVEQVVHVQDLVAAVRPTLYGPPPRTLEEGAAALAAARARGVGDGYLEPSALTLTCRLLAERAVAAEPGGAVELRVPPRVAVQLGEGSRHKRGTPPNTVEMAEETFVELAAGRRSWGSCERVGLLSVKGDRADLSRLMPLL